ncbi:MAG: tetratricopeptide repeat protein, partial [Caldilineaceae bacterium]|nr:tetratricopeptide repeat protein [Caldilineaceae bacterium]
DYARAETLSKESLALYQQLGDDRGMGWNLERLGTIARQRGDYPTAAKFYAASGECLEKLANQADMATLFLNLGELARQQDEPKKAETHYRKGLALAKALGSKRDEAALVDRLCVLDYQAGNYAKATARSEQSIALYHTLGDRFGLSEALYTRGRIAAAQQQGESALPLYLESLLLKARLGERRGISDVFGALAVVASRELPQRAVHLLAAASGLRRTLAINLPPSEQAAEEKLVDTLRVVLDDATFADAWATGQQMPLDQAIAYATEYITEETEQ